MDSRISALFFEVLGCENTMVKKSSDISKVKIKGKTADFLKKNPPNTERTVCPRVVFSINIIVVDLGAFTNVISVCQIKQIRVSQHCLSLLIY